MPDIEIEVECEECGDDLKAVAKIAKDCYGIMVNRISVSNCKTCMEAALEEWEKEAKR